MEKVIELGGKAGWSQLSVTNGITTGLGRFGYEALQLDTNSSRVSSSTDLLLSFEDSAVVDESGRYSVDAVTYRIVPDAVMGKGAALFNGRGSGFQLLGGEGTIFGTEGWSGSFVIEFWLCPSIVENGETLISWRSSRNASGYPLYQTLAAVFTGSRLEWNLTNLFSGYIGDNGEVKLRGIKTLVPGKWSHHALVYSEETGLLEYRVNGLLEDLQYMTAGGVEGGMIYPLRMGFPTAMEICPQYTGKLDDFRVLRSDGTEPDANIYALFSPGSDFARYNVDGGRFETQPIPVAEGSSLLRLNAEVSEPAQTDVQFFVRSGDNFYEWTDSYPEWQPVSPGGDISNVTGAYFQVAAQLYPDGAGSVTPTVTSVSVVYSESEPPLPPFTVRAAAGDGCVDLSWSHSIDEISGYHVYYGEHPGEYLGRVALQGDSPVPAGARNSIKITGLKNGRIYYFAVAAENNGKMGTLSSEVYARPALQAK